MIYLGSVLTGVPCFAGVCASSCIEPGHVGYLSEPHRVLLLTYESADYLTFVANVRWACKSIMERGFLHVCLCSFVTSSMSHLGALGGILVDLVWFICRALTQHKSAWHEFHYLKQNKNKWKVAFTAEASRLHKFSAVSTNCQKLEAFPDLCVWVS